MKIVINSEIKLGDSLEELWNPEGGCYEVIRFIEGKPLFWEEHLKRLERSYQKGINREQLELGKKLLLQEEGAVSQNMYISYTEDGYALYFFPGFYPPYTWYAEGIKTTLIPIARDNPEKKITRGDYKGKVKQYLEEKQVFEGLLTDHGLIREGSRSNVFFIKDHHLITSGGKKVLPGITREKVYEICESLGIVIEERSLGIEELNEVEGVFITGTSIDILPVSHIDDKKFDTINNKLYLEIHNQYNKLKEKDLA